MGLGSWLSATSLADSEQHQRVEKEIARDTQSIEVVVADKQAVEVQEMKIRLGNAVPEQTLIEYAKLQDQDSRFEFIQTQTERYPQQGLAMLVYFLDVERPTLFFRTEAFELLRRETGKDFGYNPEVGKGRNKASLYAMRKELIHKQEAGR